MVHVRSGFRLKCDPDRKTKNIITAVMQKREGEWEIVTLHVAPIQKREEVTAFVTHMAGLNQHMRTQAKERKATER